VFYSKLSKSFTINIFILINTLLFEVKLFRFIYGKRLPCYVINMLSAVGCCFCTEHYL
jgi:hypothetical protein